MKFRRQRPEEVSINLTPLIDIVFLLLIFFMVSTSFNRETQLAIDLPEATGEVREPVEQEIEILIDEGGTFLQAAIYRISAGDTTLPLAITADAQAAHEDVVKAMDAAGRMGFVHLSITTRKPADVQGNG